MIKQFIKNIGMALAPGFTHQFLAARSQALIMRIERDSGTLSASRAFVGKHGRTVLRGPFKGMRYSQRIANERNLVHRLVGSYENELHGWCEEVVRNQYGVLLDIGTADGFYAVGFAQRMPKTQVIGFDTDPWARAATKELIAENGVRNVEVKSMCSPDWLNCHLKPNSLIFSDCEGYEMVLFNSALVPALTRCDMVIELHERPAPGVEQALAARFAESHDMRLATYGCRDPEDYPELEAIPPELRASAISEGRGGPQNVMFLTRRKSARS